ncbi:hypothetical protein [Methyloferula stellata]|uniref:hypothetical protein n=1 Tax=Methyloferula stellata TaxID=876270 RepID=UPI000375629C|nr:hypothetical protein [Methyloferula stellata]
MRFETAFLCALFVGSGLGLGAAPARAGDDLILPPDMRASPPLANPSPQAAPPPKPESKRQKANAPKSDGKSKIPAAAETSDSAQPQTQHETKVGKPSAKTKADDPVSLDMKWNAANNPNAGPGGLFDEVNKNVNGGTVGTGAEVGFKYKF